MAAKTKMNRPESVVDIPHHYCPGCGHGIIHAMVGETIDELGVKERTIATAPVGCAVLLYKYYHFDTIQCAHGRAPAVATGLRRSMPDHIVFTYQGDGDLAAIGTAEIIHAANRGENITVVFVNNAIYGMTGGQMAPTTLIGQKTETTPAGRVAANDGYPIKMCEILAQLTGPAYIERVSVSSAKHALRAKKAIKKAFEYQVQGKGFSMVEVLSMCPTNWGISPKDAPKWLDENMMKEFPLGVYKDKYADK